MREFTCACGTTVYQAIPTTDTRCAECKFLESISNDEDRQKAKEFLEGIRGENHGKSS